MRLISEVFVVHFGNANGEPHHQSSAIPVMPLFRAVRMIRYSDGSEVLDPLLQQLVVLQDLMDVSQVLVVQGQLQSHRMKR